MRIKFLGLAALIVAVGVSSSSADVVWTGANSSDITDDGNYDFSGSVLTSVLGINGATLADNLVYNIFGTAPELPDVGGQVTFGAGDGFGITFDGVTATNAGGNEGWGDPFGSTSAGAVSLINGAQTRSFFYARSMVSIDATSSIILDGGGNPVNVTTIDMAPGAVVTFTAEDLAAFNTEHLSKFTVNGVALADGVNATVVSDGGAGTIVTATAIPEPGSLSVLALGLVFACTRRRK